MRKIQCHDAVSTSQPPSVGPISGPMSPGMATKLMADSSSSRGKCCRITSRPTGSSTAAPSPCSTRAAISCDRSLESAQAAEPAENSTMALRNTRCDPKRSASQPLAGISAAMVSM